MTEQLLRYAVADNKKQKTQSLNVGLVRELDSPFNLFLNLKQLINPDNRYIYFYIYSMGKRKIILWGVYEKNKKEFIIDTGCKYNTDQLYTMTMKWKANNYTYIGNSVKNRPSTLISKYLNIPTLTYEEYTEFKYIIAYIDDKITDSEFIEKYGEEHLEVLELMDTIDLLDYREELLHKVTEYDQYINRTDIMYTVQKSLSSEVFDTLVLLTKRFQHIIERGNFNTLDYEKTLKKCRYLDECRGDECAVYFYGNTDLGFLYEEDPDWFL